MELKELAKQIDRLYATAIIALIIVLAMGLVLVSCMEPKKEMISTLDLNQEELITRGAYLVNTSGCNDCHSPKVMTPHGPEPDPERL